MSKPQKQRRTANGKPRGPITGAPSATDGPQEGQGKPLPCVRCGAATDQRFWLDPSADESASLPCCCACRAEACSVSATDRGLRFERGWYWLKAEERKRKGADRG